MPFHKVNGSILIALPEKMVEDPVLEPPTKMLSTDEHISLYSLATGPGGSSSKNSLSHTRSTDYWA